VYFAYCKLCNFLDADLRKDSVFENLLDHQERSHKRIEADKIVVFRVNLPFAQWLEAKATESFWTVWRLRSKLGVKVVP